MDIEVKEITELDQQLVTKLTAIEKEAFGLGGMNRWFLIPFIRHGKVYVLFKEGEPIALIEYMLSFASPQSAYLFGLAVQAEFRGQGFGKKLLKTSLARLKQQGIQRISLTVSPHNPIAKRLYDFSGFIEYEVCPDEYGPGEDRLALELDLVELKEEL